MSLFSLAREGLLSRGIPSLIPIVRKFSNAQIMAFLPTDKTELTELLRLPTIPSRDSVYFFLNFLRYLDQKQLSSETIQQRVKQYFIKPIISSNEARITIEKTYGFPGIQSIILTPTVACNLRCEHCYNLFEIHEHNRERLPFETMNKVLGEAQQLGAFRATFIGGEPLLRWEELVQLAKNYPDTLCTIFTNGLLLDRSMAKEIAKIGNIELAFSIDGPAELHDRWRGEGHWQKSMTAMKLFSEEGGMSLCSPTVTTENYRAVLSDDFLDQLVGCGAYMVYVHHYDLLGGQSRVDWLMTRNQLVWLKNRIEEIHKTKKISVLSNVVGDLLRGGCPAVRDFVHINHKGEIEPCCMVPFSGDSVREKSLLEALRGPFLSHLRKIEPDNTGIKRCLVGGNANHLQTNLAQGIAHGTTLKSSQVFDSIHQGMQDNLPTCFSYID